MSSNSRSPKSDDESIVPTASSADNFDEVNSEYLEEEEELPYSEGEYADAEGEYDDAEGEYDDVEGEYNDAEGEYYDVEGEHDNAGESQESSFDERDSHYPQSAFKYPAGSAQPYPVGMYAGNPIPSHITDVYYTDQHLEFIETDATITEFQLGASVSVPYPFGYVRNASSTMGNFIDRDVHDNLVIDPSIQPEFPDSTQSSSDYDDGSMDGNENLQDENITDDLVDPELQNLSTPIRHDSSDENNSSKADITHVHKVELGNSDSEGAPGGVNNHDAQYSAAAVQLHVQSFASGTEVGVDNGASEAAIPPGFNQAPYGPLAAPFAPYQKYYPFAQAWAANNTSRLISNEQTSGTSTDSIGSADVVETGDGSIVPKIQELSEDEQSSDATIVGLKHGSNGIILDYLEDQSRVVAAMSKKLKYPSLEAASAASTNRPPPSYIPPQDPSKPVTDEEKCAYVLMLMDAALDMRFVEDNEGIRTTWGNSLDRDRQKIELGAWRVLEILLDYHSRPGFVGRRPRRRNNLVGEKYETFAAHVDKLCDIFRRQKTACRALVQEENLITIVDDPDKHEERTRNNRRINEAKKHVASENRELAEAGRKLSQANEPEALDHLLQLASSPPTQTSTRKKRVRAYDEDETKEPKVKRKRGLKAAVKEEVIAASPLPRPKAKASKHSSTDSQSTYEPASGSETSSAKEAPPVKKEVPATPSPLSMGKRSRGRPRKSR